MPMAKALGLHDFEGPSNTNHSIILQLAVHLMLHNFQHDSGSLDFLFIYKCEKNLIESIASVKA